MCEKIWLELTRILFSQFQYFKVSRSYTLKVVPEHGYHNNPKFWDR